MEIKERERLRIVKNLFDTSCRADMNVHNFSGTNREHSERVSQVCHALYYDLKTPFFTEVKFKNGYRPDVLAPLHIGGVMIEVRNSETDKLSAAKQVPHELQDLGFITIYVDCDKEFKLRDIQ